MRETHDIRGWIERTEQLLVELQSVEHEESEAVEIAHRVGEIARRIGEDLDALLGQFGNVELFMFHMADDERVSHTKVSYYAQAIPGVADEQPVDFPTLKTEIIDLSQAARRLLMTLQDETVSKFRGVHDFLHDETTIDFPEPAHPH